MHFIHHYTEAFGWALVHFLWQGMVVALLLGMALRLLRQGSAQLRYAAIGLALLLMLGAFAVTLGVVWERPLPAAVPVNRPNETFAANRAYQETIVDPAANAEAPPAQISQPPPVAAVPVADAARLPARVTVPFSEKVRPYLPWAVGVWALGVVCFALRFLFALLAVRGWKRSGHDIVGAEWKQRFSKLCSALEVSRPARLLSSAAIAVPMVIGWLKPVVLVPAGLFTGLTTAELEAILAHELAHIRRHDYLTNLFQHLMETVFFYHPAVWWASNKMRQEREHCCDDLAAIACGGVLGYAKALTALEELRGAAPVLGVSASGGSLLARIRRIMGLPEEKSRAWPLGLLAVLALAIIPFAIAKEEGRPGPLEKENDNKGGGVPPFLERGGVLQPPDSNSAKVSGLQSTGAFDEPDSPTPIDKIPLRLSDDLSLQTVPNSLSATGWMSDERIKIVNSDGPEDLPGGTFQLNKTFLNPSLNSEDFVYLEWSPDTLGWRHGTQESWERKLAAKMKYYEIKLDEVRCTERRGEKLEMTTYYPNVPEDRLKLPTEVLQRHIRLVASRREKDAPTSSSAEPTPDPTKGQPTQAHNISPDPASAKADGRDAPPQKELNISPSAPHLVQTYKEPGIFRLTEEMSLMILEFPLGKSKDQSYTGVSAQIVWKDNRFPPTGITPKLIGGKTAMHMGRNVTFVWQEGEPTMWLINEYNVQQFDMTASGEVQTVPAQRWDEWKNQAMMPRKIWEAVKNYRHQQDINPPALDHSIMLIHWPVIEQAVPKSKILEFTSGGEILLDNQTMTRAELEDYISTKGKAEVAFHTLVTHPEMSLDLLGPIVGKLEIEKVKFGVLAAKRTSKNVNSEKNSKSTDAEAVILNGRVSNFSNPKYLPITEVSEEVSSSILWTDPIRGQMRLGISGVTSGAQWNQGSSVKFKLYLRNDGGTPQLLSWTSRLDDGLRICLTDSNGVAHDAVMKKREGEVLPSHNFLRPDQVMEVKSIDLDIVAKAPEQGDDFNAALAVDPGKYTLKVTHHMSGFINQNGKSEPVTGEWVETVDSAPLEITISKEEGRPAPIRDKESTEPEPGLKPTSEATGSNAQENISESSLDIRHAGSFEINSEAKAFVTSVPDAGLLRNELELRAIQANGSVVSDRCALPYGTSTWAIHMEPPAKGQPIVLVLLTKWGVQRFAFYHDRGFEDTHTFALLSAKDLASNKIPSDIGKDLLAWAKRVWPEVKAEEAEVRTPELEVRLVAEKAEQPEMSRPTLWRERQRVGKYVQLGQKLLDGEGLRFAGEICVSVVRYSYAVKPEYQGAWLSLASRFQGRRAAVLRNGEIYVTFDLKADTASFQSFIALRDEDELVGQSKEAGRPAALEKEKATKRRETHHLLERGTGVPPVSPSSAPTPEPSETQPSPTTIISPDPASAKTDGRDAHATSAEPLALTPTDGLNLHMPENPTLLSTKVQPKSSDWLAEEVNGALMELISDTPRGLEWVKSQESEPHKSYPTDGFFYYDDKTKPFRRQLSDADDLIGQGNGLLGRVSEPTKTQPSQTTIISADPESAKADGRDAHATAELELYGASDGSYHSVSIHQDHALRFTLISQKPFTLAEDSTATSGTLVIPVNTSDKTQAIRYRYAVEKPDVLQIKNGRFEEYGWDLKRGRVIWIEFDRNEFTAAIYQLPIESGPILTQEGLTQITTKARAWLSAADDKAKWEQTRVLTHDYKSGMPVDAAAEKIMWGGSNEVGLRLGIGGVDPHAEIPSGQTIPLKQYIRNDSKETIRLSPTGFFNEGIDAEFVRADGVKFPRTPNYKWPIGFIRVELKPGQYCELQSSPLDTRSFNAPPDQYALKLSHRIGLFMGKPVNTFLGDPRIAPGLGEWTGTLQAAPWPFKLMPSPGADGLVRTAVSGDRFTIITERGKGNMDYNLSCGAGKVSFAKSDGTTLWRVHGSAAAPENYSAAWLVSGKRIWLYSETEGVYCIEFDPLVKEIGRWKPDDLSGSLGEMPAPVRKALKLPIKEEGRPAPQESGKGVPPVRPDMLPAEPIPNSIKGQPSPNTNISPDPASAKADGRDAYATLSFAEH